MTLDQRIAELLAHLPPVEQLEFAALQDAIYQVRFTGPVTIDFLNGVPRQISLGQPVKLAICHATPAGGLDKPGKSKAP